MRDVNADGLILPRQRLREAAQRELRGSERGEARRAADRGGRAADDQGAGMARGHRRQQGARAGEGAADARAPGLVEILGREIRESGDLQGSRVTNRDIDVTMNTD